MRGNKFEKSCIHILESETLSRESRVTESAQEIVDSIPCNCEWYSYINSCQFYYFTVKGMFYKKVGMLLGGCLTFLVLLMFMLQEMCGFYFEGSEYGS